MEIPNKPLPTLCKISKSSFIRPIKLNILILSSVPPLNNVSNIQPRYAILLRQCICRFEFARRKSNWNLCCVWCFHLAGMAQYILFCNRVLTDFSDACFIYGHSKFGSCLYFLFWNAFLLEWGHHYLWMGCLWIFIFFKNYFLNRIN